MTLELEPAYFRSGLARQISDAIVHLNQSKKQHPILICDEAHLLPHPALEQLSPLLSFDMDSAHAYLLCCSSANPVAARAVSADS